MKYYQKIQELIQKEIRLHRVIKLICFFSVPLFFVSCKTFDTNSYSVVNSLLNDYTEKSSVYLYPKIVKLDDKKIEEFLLLGIDIDSCNAKIKDVILNLDKEILVNNKLESWNYKKIDTSKIFTRLDLKLPQSIIRYKKLKETINDEYDLLDRKFRMWKLEHEEGMIMLSYPLFNKRKTYAIINLSKINDGQFVFTLKRIGKKNWSVICKKRLSHY